MRNFVLQRDEDVSGVSGVGVVADGCVFPDGVTVVHWRGDYCSTSVWPNVEMASRVHGHEGKTRFVWLDE